MAIKDVSIYGLVDPRQPSAIRYVGKTTRRLKVRLWYHLSGLPKSSCATHKDNWLCKLLTDGIRPQIILLARTTSEKWQRDERKFIAKYKAAGHPLTNLTPGGDGVHNPAASTRAKYSKNTRKLWKTREYREKIVAAHKQQWQDPEHRIKQAKSHEATWKDPERRERMSDIGKRLWEDPDYRARQLKHTSHRTAILTEKNLVEKRNASIRIAWADPERKLRQSITTTLSWAKRHAEKQQAA